jgi:hypothetical protein
MFCHGYEERAIEMLYGELDPLDEQRFEAHVAGCEACRRELEELGRVRTALQSAAPDVPVAPRVVILSAPPRRLPTWALAAGVAGIGLLAGLALSWSWQARATAATLAADLATHRPDASATAPALPASIEGIIDQRVRDQVASYLAAHQTNVQTPKVIDANEFLTAADFDARLTRFDRKLDRERASDLQYLLDQLANIEARTTARFGETEQALRYVALASDPRVSER